MTTMVKVEIYFENEEGTWSGVHEIDPDTNFHEEMAKHTQGMDTRALVFEVERVKGDDDAPFNFDPILDGMKIPLNASFEDAVGLPVHFISIHPKFHGMTDREIEVAKDEAFDEMNRAKKKLDELLNESTRRDRENPTVKLIVKDDTAPIHYVMTVPVDDTVLKLKIFMLGPKIGNSADWDAMDEQAKMAYSAILKVFDKDGNLLEDLKEWSEILPFPLPQFFEVRVECLKSPDDVETLTKFGIHMMNTQVLYSVLQHRQLYDKIELNKKHKPEFYKGTLSVHCGDKVFYYHYGELETVGCLIDLLEDEYCLMFHGLQGVFKLRAGRSGSFLYDHEPIWANNYTTVEIVASFNGGGKRPKADRQDPITPKDIRFKVNSMIEQLGQSEVPVIAQTVQRAKEILQIVDGAPKKGATALLKKVPCEKLTSLITDTIGHSARVKDKSHFIAELVLADDFHGLDLLKFRGQMAQELLSNVALYAITLEFADSNNSISWSALTKKASEVMAEQMSDANQGYSADASNCDVM